jgi:ribosome maturation factor RimP
LKEVKMRDIQAKIEAVLAESDPDVEVLRADVVGGTTVRVFIDHPDGVSLGLCEQVTKHLAPVREDYSLEVSSPGPERPLTKPDHFRRFLGRRAKVRTTEPVVVHDGEQPHHTFTGELVGATEQEITLAAAGGVVAIPYVQIARSNLVGE